ncbi:endogenous retrovirus group K member 7 Gag polyprotein-like [Melopsittacus undulatus]|uniref:endogenous retrovirus group K member 7 Gag polyprotein-like n=1 Tax=Melopsittacus undulatus TaxID=13146 RepID=UPI00146F716D|nr:endogenous retrovirus group K member 7 Gag polyprotein-like [Melopsittacus undulatus]
MIDQMHAEAEIAAALKDALSESTKNSDLGETDLIEGGPLPDPVPPRTSPEKTKIAAPVHKKGEFDDLIIPWDPSDELPTQPSAPPEPEPMEVLPENVPLPSDDDDELQKESPYAELVKELRQQRHQMARLMIAVKNLDKDGDTGKKKEMYKKAMEAIKEGIKNIERQLDQKEKLDAGGREGIERAKGYIPKRVNEYIPTDHSFDMGRRQNGAEWTPLDWNLVSKLQQSVMAYGATNSAVRRQMTAFMKYQELVPADIRLLMETLLGATAFTMFLVKWQERLELKQLDNVYLPDGDPLKYATLEMLMGTGRYIDPQRQAALPPRVLSQSKAAALEAFSALLKMGKPNPPYLQIKQGDDELFLTFMDRVRDSIDSNPDIDPDIKTPLLKEVATQNANTTCKRLIATLPQGASLVQMIDICSKAPLEEEKQRANIHAVALAAALKHGGLGKGDNGPGRGQCYQCGQMGHLKKHCPLKGKKEFSKPSANICNRCDKFGHKAADCKSRFKKDGTPLSENFQRRELGAAPKYSTAQQHAMAASMSSQQQPTEAQASTWPWQEQ